MKSDWALRYNNILLALSLYFHSDNDRLNGLTAPLNPDSVDNFQISMGHFIVFVFGVHNWNSVTNK